MWSFLLISVGPPGSWIISQSVDGPGQFIERLGIAGLVAMVLVLWQRDTARQRDKERDLNIAAAKDLVPVLHEVLAALKRSNDTHNSGAEASKQVSEALKLLPDPRFWPRLERAVEDRERTERGAGGS